MNSKFTVGEFAKLHNMSKQTLIFYDKIGLIKPSIVDENNGYRYYTAEQLELLDTIFILKEIGVPLKTIKEFLQNREAKSSIKLFTEQKAIIDETIANLKRTTKKLDKKIQILKRLSEINTNKEVIIKKMPAQYLMVEDVKPPYQLLETDIATKALLTKATKNKYIYNYQLGVIISKENLLSKNFTLTEKAFTVIEDPNIPGALLKPESLCAIIYHKGEYSKIGEAYERLIQHVYKKGYELDGPSYEFCILDCITSASRDDYITEIVIPIKKVS